MKRYVFFNILSVVVAMGCNAPTQRNTSAEDAFSKLQTNPKGDSTLRVDVLQFAGDSSIAGIVLRDARSVLDTIGDLSINVVEHDDAPSDVILANKDKTEFLRLTMWYGDPKNYFSYVQVSREKLNTNAHRETNIENFITESGVRIGIRKEQLLAIKGNRYQVDSVGSLLVIKYDDGDLYQAKYFFDRNVLVRFEFGFVNP